MLNSSNFILKEIPKLNPLSLDYLNYWKDFKKKSIEGEWVTGKWIPGNFWFYLNACVIELNKTRNAKTKVIGRPLFFDYLLEVSYLWNEARGLIGFDSQPEVIAYKNFLEKEIWTEERDLELKSKIPNIRTVLANSTKDLGKPLYLNEAQDFMWLTARDTGKDLEENTKIFLEDKEIPIKDVKIGDRIYGADGKLTTVVQRKDFNNQLQYRITLADNREIIAGKGHLWNVIDYLGNTHTFETEYLYNTYKYGSRNDNRYFIPMQKPIDYLEKSLPLHPYTLGVILGDGGLTGSNVIITSADKEIIDNLVLPENDIVVKLKNKYNYNIKGTTRKQSSNNTKNILRDLGLYGHLSTDKFIPEQYFYGSIEQRLDLLKGLMDTDGTVGKNSHISFSTSSPLLARDFKRLLEGLGIRNKVSIKKTTHKDSYRFSILTKEKIFKLKRKLDKLVDVSPKSSKSKTSCLQTAIVKIEPIGIKPSVCIAVDNENKLFQAGNNIVTHNSFYVANAVILHEFLFDGAKEYNVEENKSLKTTITVGAGVSDYSIKMLEKTQLSYTNLPGSIELNGRFYPSPLSKKYSGSWAVGKKVTQLYKKKTGGSWQDKGTGTTLRHITYKDNPFAAQGSRNSIIVKEECGHFDNLIETHGPDQFTLSDSGRKFGSAFYLGTGGNMEGGGTTGAKKMCYAPDEYNLLSINDIWENKGKIAYFTPATIAKRNYKNQDGYTNLELAEELEQRERNKIKKGADANTRLANYIQYNPLVPSEIFLSTTSNIFPVGELQDVLAHLESNQNYLNYETVIDIYFDKDTETGVNWKVDLEKKSEPITDFPLKDNQSREGAVIMYEEPIKINGKVPNDAYILGHDPVANDNPDGPSLSATYILKNKKYFLTHGGDEIVAEYISRPSIGRSKTNETLEKLWMMYGSPSRGVYFENAVGNTKEYFEKRKKLVALCTQPETILSKTGAYTSAGTIVYGYPMSNKKIKKEAELYLRDWLIEEKGKADKIQMNLHLIKSRFLLKQLIAYSSDGNYDAVLGFMGCIIGLEETHNQYYQEQEEDPIIQYLINNDIYFDKRNKGNKNKNIYEELDNIFKK